MKRTEQQLTTKLLKHIRANREIIPDCVLVEVKHAQKGKPFYVSSLSDKAKRLLQKKGLTWKFSDATMTGTPLDFVHIPNGKMNAMLCIIWWEPRKDKVAYFLTSDCIKGGKVTEDEAAMNAKYTIVFK